MSEETGKVVRVVDSGTAEVQIVVPPPADYNCCGVPVPGAAITMKARNSVRANVGDAVRVETRSGEGVKVMVITIITPVVFAAVGYTLSSPWGALAVVPGLLAALWYNRSRRRSMIPNITAIVDEPPQS